MLLETRADFEIERSKPFKTYDMDIKNPQILFDILCDKTYQYPLITMVQEYMSNARDAHRESGIADRPIEIILPTLLDPTLSIKDFGPGISPQRMQDVFIYLGGSTKRGDNRQHGGFGIGAKIGFAYTDTFHILSRFDGNEIEYMVYKGPDRLGHIDHITELPTEDHTGVTIQLPIQLIDIDRICRAVMKCCFFWRVQPKLINIPRKFSHIELKGWNIPQDQMLCVPYDHRNNLYLDILEIQADPLVVVDRIIYGTLQESLEIPYKKLLRPTVLFLETGEVDVAVNRENLQYNNHTWTILKNIIQRNIKVSRDKAIGTLINTPSYELNGLRDHLSSVINEVVTKITIEANWGDQTIFYQPSKPSPLSIRIPDEWNVQIVVIPNVKKIEKQDIYTLKSELPGPIKQYRHDILPLDTNDLYIIDDRDTASVSLLMVNRWIKKTYSSGKRYIILRHRDRHIKVDEWVFKLAEEITIDLLSNYVKKSKRKGQNGRAHKAYTMTDPYQPRVEVDELKNYKWLVERDDNLLLTIPRREAAQISHCANRIDHAIKILVKLGHIRDDQVRFVLISNVSGYKRILREYAQVAPAIPWLAKSANLIRNIQYENFQQLQFAVVAMRKLKYRLGESLCIKADRMIPHYYTDILAQLPISDIKDPYIAGIVEYEKLRVYVSKHREMREIDVFFNGSSETSRRYKKFVTKFWYEIHGSSREVWDIQEYKILTALANSGIMSPDIIPELVHYLNNHYMREKDE